MSKECGWCNHEWEIILSYDRDGPEILACYKHVKEAKELFDRRLQEILVRK